jgi:branched-chain amino acid transport system permease protein
MSTEIAVIMSLLIAGISRGMIYFLLASGLTLIFGVLNVINFAHGAFYMLGVFLCYTVSKGVHFGIAFLLIPIIMGLIGAIAEFGLFRRIYKAEHAMQLLLSLGVIYIISDIVRLVWGVTPKSQGIPSTFQGFVNLQGVVVSKYNFFIIGITLFIALFMFLILYKTKTGSIIRACTINHEMTRCVGIDVSRVFLLVFMTGIALAGLASVTAAPIVTSILGMDAQMIMVAFCVIIIGGVGSIGGALVAALIIWVVDSLGILILPQFSEAFMYAIAVVSLLIRPRGLFGKLAG